MRDIAQIAALAAITGLRCPCGAQRNRSARRCRKCSARGRWHRRREWRSRKIPARYRNGRKLPRMTVSVPLVVISGILLYLVWRYKRLRAWHAAIALIFGFLLAKTAAAPEIRSLLSGLLAWLHKP